MNWLPYGSFLFIWDSIPVITEGKEMKITIGYLWYYLIKVGFDNRGN